MENIIEETLTPIRKRRSSKVEAVEETSSEVAEKPKRAKKETLKEEKPVYETYEDFPFEDLCTYAGLDCIVTSKLAIELSTSCYAEPRYYISRKEGNKVVKEEAKAMSIFESYDRFTKPAFDFIIDLETNGIEYDVEGNARMAAQMVAEVAQLEDSIYTTIGKKINLDSGDVMADFLYNEKGFEVLSRTKTGEPSTDGDALAELAKKYDLPWLKVIAKRKDIVSIYRTFIENYVADFVQRDGRIHASYNLHGTSSFRISSDSPNFTQIPRPKHGYNIRTLFVPTKGYVFLALDFNSCEVKVLGAMSKDPALLKAIEDGMDFHTFSASEMYGIPYEKMIEVLSDDTNPLYKEYKGYRQNSKALKMLVPLSSDR